MIAALFLSLLVSSAPDSVLEERKFCEALDPEACEWRVMIQVSKAGPRRYTDWGSVAEKDSTVYRIVRLRPGYFAEWWTEARKKNSNAPTIQFIRPGPTITDTIFHGGIP
jgi:hypothetical protein